MKITTIAQLRKELGIVQNANTIHRKKLSLLDKIALALTNKIGTMQFFFFCLILVTIPLFFPYTLPVVQYISSGYLQLILLPLLMIGQNLQGRHTEVRAENDYRVNMKAEKEVETILLHLETQQQTMLEILKRIEKLEEHQK